MTRKLKNVLWPNQLLDLRELIERHHEEWTDRFQALCHHPATEMMITIPGGGKSRICGYCRKTLRIYPFKITAAERRARRALTAALKKEEKEHGSIERRV